MNSPKNSLMKLLMGFGARFKKNAARIWELFNIAGDVVPKLCVVYCGDVISKAKNLGDENRLSAILTGLEPRIKELADFDTVFVNSDDSTNISVELWDKLVKIIDEKYDRYDGFVILHGTNTMAYTSAALSFALGDIGKPIVLTGAQVPVGELGSDAKENFVSAIRLAVKDIAGVYVVFGTRVILGTRAKKVDNRDVNAFESFNTEDIGVIEMKLRLRPLCKRRHSRPLHVQLGFDNSAFVITLEPGLKREYVDAVIDAGIRGLIVRAYGSGEIPLSFFPCLKKSHEKKVPVLITTQCPRGAVDMSKTILGRKALEFGAIPVFDMSMEAMTTKLMWLLHQKVPYEKMKDKIAENIAGEVEDVLLKV